MDFVSPEEFGISSPYPAEEQSLPPQRSTATLRRSCETCRYSKSRCCPSGVDPRRCQRCIRDGKQCVFLEAKPRPKRVKTSKTRVAEMEEKLDGIFALLSAKYPDKPGINVDQFGAISPPDSTANGPIDSAMVHQQQLVIADMFQPTALTSLPWMKTPEIPDVIGKGIISIERAESLLSSYCTHAPNFPFIFIPSHYNLEYLRTERPFLLLSILSVCARTDMTIRTRLETELRESLARKAIVNGEKSLDLLQGLLVYLCWYHHFYDPQTEQIYQLSQMVISMAVELGITRPDRKGITGMCSFDGCYPSGNPRVRRFHSELEATRTFLGCYYLSSSLANAFRKPSNLKYTDYVEQCVQTLAEANDAPTDRLLPYFIRVQRLCEEINTTFDYDGHQQLPPLDAIRIEMLTKSFSRQLKQFEETFPAEVWKIVAIRMAYHSMHISIHEIALHATPQTAGAVDGFGGASTTDWYSSVARTDSLISCVDAAKRYLDRYSALSSEDIYQSTITEEMRQVYAILVLARFATGVSSPYLDATHLRNTANIQHHISDIIDRISPLVTVLDNGQEQADYFWHLRRLFQSTKGWFTEQARLGSFSTLETSGLQDCTELSFMEILKVTPEEEPPVHEYDAVVDPKSWFSKQDNQMWDTAMLEAYPTPTLDPRTISFNGVME